LIFRGKNHLADPKDTGSPKGGGETARVFGRGAKVEQGSIVRRKIEIEWRYCLSPPKKEKNEWKAIIRKNREEKEKAGSLYGTSGKPLAA